MTAASLSWFARHELNLFWRDWSALVVRGKAHRKAIAALALIGFFAGMHVVAWLTVSEIDLAQLDPKAVYIFISGCGLVSLSLMTSQSLESVTRAFYARADLDLILTSPAPSSRIFTIRICAVALTSVAMSAILLVPFFNVMAWREGPAWLLGYFGLLSMSAIATSVSLLIAVLLFRLFGPAKTRFISQILAALIGAGFAISMQIVAIVYFGNLSRLSVLTEPAVLKLLPDPASPVWIPARAFLGNVSAALAFTAFGAVLLAGCIRLFSPQFATLALSTAGIREKTGRNRKTPTKFRPLTLRQTLRNKELTLLARDPWLLSQTLMQMLYLLVPAVLLWRNFGSETGAMVVVAPVIVMASGQLAGGLAWLTLCGEDAPDLVQTAPVAPLFGLYAKIEAVLVAVGIFLAPILAALMLIDPYAALVTAACLALSAGAATAMQVWFRAQAKRSHFRHRHASSKIATFAEAFSSISWAGCAALLTVGSWLAAFPAILALIVLGVVWTIRPKDK